MKLFGSKKTWLTFSAIAFSAVLIAGGAYAWFTASASTSPYSYKAGNLGIETEFTSDYMLDEHGHMMYYDGQTWREFGGIEPGNSYDIGTKVTNTGSLSSMVKYGLQPKTEVVYAEDLTPLETAYVLEGEQNPILLNLIETNNIWDWQSNLENIDTMAVGLSDAEGNLYFMMNPAVEFEGFFSLDLQTNAAEIGNRFMDATTAVGSDIRATQIIEEAVKSEFGVDYASLSPYIPAATTGVRGMSRMSATSLTPQYTVAEVVDYLLSDK